MNVLDAIKVYICYVIMLCLTVGTIILWMFWPSFNSAFAQGEGEYRAILNTYFAMVACVVASFATSAFVHKDRFSMVCPHLVLPNQIPYNPVCCDPGRGRDLAPSLGDGK